MRPRIWLVGALLLTWASPVWSVDVQQVYSKKCELCHSIDGKGGKKKDFGGPLDGVGSKRDEAWLRAYLADPKSKIDGAKMPKMKLTAEEMDAIVEFLLSLQ